MVIHNLVRYGMLNISFNFVVWIESVPLHCFHIFQTDLAGIIYLRKLKK